MNYTQNDNELIYLLNEDSDHYRYILFEKYKPIIISIVNDYYDRFNGLYIDYDDLFQEGLIGFNNAINSYNTNNSIFYTYASICIKRSVISYIRKLYSKKNLLFNNSLDDSYYDTFIVFDNDIFLSNMYEYEFTYLKNVLSNEESLVFELKYNGFSNTEICKLLELSIYKITRILYKTKFNLRKTN